MSDDAEGKKSAGSHPFRVQFDLDESEYKLLEGPATNGGRAVSTLAKILFQTAMPLFREADFETAKLMHRIAGIVEMPVKAPIGDRRRRRKKAR